MNGISAPPGDLSTSKPTRWDTYKCFVASAFFVFGEIGDRTHRGTNLMDQSNSSMAQQIAQAVTSFERRRTGHAPSSVTVVLSENTLVITLHGTLSPAERALAKHSAGAAQVQEFHRQLFNASADELRAEIRRITGAEVREAAAEADPNSGTVVKVFSTGTMVQVFLLAHAVPAGSWTGNGSDIGPEGPVAPAA
jgi:uncharacterized protein YbcI